MTTHLRYSLAFLFSQAIFCYSQNPQLDLSGIRIMFYNVENLFHPENDSLKSDDDFTKDGPRHWNYTKYQKKINQIAQNVIAIGEWEPPAVIGLCEVENLQCLKDLIFNSPLSTFNYQIVHQESGDKRGIDVAFLVRSEFFQIIEYKAFVLDFPNSSSATRDILYMKGLTGQDTLHCLVNHWPSRYGGELATKPKRNFAASILRSKFDSIQNITPSAKIIAMGDFNDYPTDESMKDILSAKKDTNNITLTDLINLTWQYEKTTGTNKYQHEWHILDQFIINQTLLESNESLYTSFHLSHIFKASWLFTDEADGFGKKPFRTYNGFKYIGGYSDHLPIYTDILFIK
ncbi:MAG: endonuclease/exonuclease/phosphatase family protein [Crocinitomicaceae bacterium]